MSSVSTSHLFSVTLIQMMCALWVYAPGVARAQESTTTASEDYSRGAELYNEGRNREALQAFNSAIKKANEPVYICNRALVLITLEEYDRAIEDLKICRDTYEMPESSRAQVDAKLRALEVFEILIRPHAREVAGLVANPPVKAVVNDPVGRVSSPPPLPARRSGLRTAGWISLGLGAGALVGMGAVEAVNMDDVSRYREVCTSPSMMRTQEVLSECGALKSSLDTQQRLARTLLISGGVLAVGGLVMVVATRERKAVSWQLSPSISSDGAHVTWWFSF